MLEEVGEQDNVVQNYKGKQYVWKAIVDLRQKEDLEIFTCSIDQGIGIIKKNKNSSILKIEKSINKLKFEDYYNNYKEYLRMISLEEFKKMF